MVRFCSSTLPQFMHNWDSTNRGIVRIFNPWVPNSYFTPKIGPQTTFLGQFQSSFLKSKGAKRHVSKLMGAMAPMAPVLTAPLLHIHVKMSQLRLNWYAKEVNFYLGAHKILWELGMPMRSRPMPHKHIPAILIRYKLSVDHVYSSSVMQICAELWTRLELKKYKTMKH